MKYKGEPLPSGTITFMCQAGEKKVTYQIKDGKYAVQNLNPGPVKVSVVTIAPSKGGSPPGGGKAIEDPDADKTPAGKYVPIPQKYSNGETSGLDFELKGEGTGPRTLTCNPELALRGSHG